MPEFGYLQRFSFLLCITALVTLYTAHTISDYCSLPPVYKYEISCPDDYPGVCDYESERN